MPCRITHNIEQDCPAGSYCDADVTVPLKEVTAVCPKGRYCPLKTEVADKFACPKGTFNDLESQDELTDCKDCTAGTDQLTDIDSI